MHFSWILWWWRWKKICHRRVSSFLVKRLNLTSRLDCWKSRVYVHICTFCVCKLVWICLTYTYILIEILKWWGCWRERWTCKCKKWSKNYKTGPAYHTIIPTLGVISRCAIVWRGRGPSFKGISANGKFCLWFGFSLWILFS